VFEKKDTTDCDLTWKRNRGHHHVRPISQGGLGGLRERRVGVSGAIECYLGLFRERDRNETKKHAAGNIAIIWEKCWGDSFSLGKLITRAREQETK